MDRYEQVIELAKRRGFLWNSFELYGGVAGFYDYGPLGCTLKRRIENMWREFYVINEGFMEIETPTIGIEDVFMASGHISGFSDPLCECLECGEAFRADHLVENHVELADALTNTELDNVIHDKDVTCPECGGNLGCAYEFNLMFKTGIGPGNGREGYMRPETAQGIFIDFQRLARYYREKLPFGATQIGKSFRNEISPRQGVIRLREFTQAEAEIFINPKHKKHPEFQKVADTLISICPSDCKEMGTAEKITVGQAVEDGIIAHEFLGYHIALTHSFLTGIGIRPDDLRFRQHKKDEMAHYAIDCWDAEIRTDRFGWIETVGIADRTDYDLKAHSKISKQDLSVYIEYDEPVISTRFAVKPDMGKIGPVFKGKAKQVAEALKDLDREDIDTGDDIKVVVDGDEVSVPRDMVNFTEETVKISGETVVPHVIEPSYGIDRILYCTMEHAFEEETVPVKERDESEESRTVLRFKPEIAPIQIAVLPLLTRNELITPAKKIVNSLKRKGLMVVYDDSGTIGRRYRRNDEIGTPYSITIDYQTLEDSTVTIRDRDSMKQIRSTMDGLEELLYGLIHGQRAFAEAGETV
ncbi:glycyl-tRNA synthetase [Methanosalsum zhilinae DSM 4017]|uniref:glycine--tRNA ligase n=1 Tax=Methanosalsum zhilinae (strain DSM 4017 / NBRC 107636 / OCM 62 / WeN5) TaxID=679901 RepID=F7XNM8_METZD|nr:glycine--tRNA ligase [Methanosalsum zhilinae]AEH60129.1 glycyl-tRNA synthetase [Methanosalsum zhilinae DSM 4017]